MCLALVVGNPIGSGVFLLPPSLAPFGLNSVLAWAFTACGAILLAIVFARLSRAGAEAVIWGAVLLLLGVPLYFLVRKTIR
jgi:hypothetical protein